MVIASPDKEMISQVVLDANSHIHFTKFLVKRADALIISCDIIHSIARSVEEGLEHTSEHRDIIVHSIQLLVLRDILH